MFCHTEGSNRNAYDCVLLNELGELHERMNAVELLRSDHEVVERLFAKIEAAESAKKAEIFKQIKAGLDAHAYIEETIFYPAIQQDGDEVVVDLVAGALQDHLKAKTFLGELAANIGNSVRFDALLTKLIEDVRAHVDEEENQMFPLVESQFDADTLNKWGSQMKAESERFEASAETIHA